MPANGQIVIDGKTGDDFGVDTVTLKMKIVGVLERPLPDRPYLNGTSPSFRRATDDTWPTDVEYKGSVDLAKLTTDAAGRPLALTKDMVIEFWLEVTDNCSEPRPNLGTSNRKRVTLTAPKVEPMAKKDLDKKKDERKNEEKKHDAQQQDKFNKENREPPKNDGEKQPGDKNGGEKKPGDKQPNDKQPGDKTNPDNKGGNDGKGENPPKNPPMTGDPDNMGTQPPPKAGTEPPKPGDERPAADASRSAADGHEPQPEPDGRDRRHRANARSEEHRQER